MAQGLAPPIPLQGLSKARKLKIPPARAPVCGDVEGKGLAPQDDGPDSQQPNDLKERAAALRAREKGAPCLVWPDGGAPLQGAHFQKALRVPRRQRKRGGLGGRQGKLQKKKNPRNRMIPGKILGLG